MVIQLQWRFCEGGANCGVDGVSLLSLMAGSRGMSVVVVGLVRSQMVGDIRMWGCGMYGSGVTDGVTPVVVVPVRGVYVG